VSVAIVVGCMTSDWSPAKVGHTAIRQRWDRLWMCAQAVAPLAHKMHTVQHQTYMQSSQHVPHLKKI
jgi:hypothetical protein